MEGSVTLGHERKTSAEMLVKTIIFIGALGFAVSSRRPLFAVLSEVYRAIHEHIEEGWIEVTPSLLMEVLSCCALLPFAPAVITCSDLSIAGG